MLDDIEVTQEHVDPDAVEVEPAAPFMIRPQAPSGCTSPYAARTVRSTAHPVVEPEVPVAAGVGLADRPRAADHHGLDAGPRAQFGGQLQTRSGTMGASVIAESLSAEVIDRSHFCPSRPTWEHGGMTSMSIERVGVVGCGLMGSGIAEVCARAGLDVRGPRGRRRRGRGRAARAIMGSLDRGGALRQARRGRA